MVGQCALECPSLRSCLALMLSEIVRGLFRIPGLFEFGVEISEWDCISVKLPGGNMLVFSSRYCAALWPVCLQM